MANHWLLAAASLLCLSPRALQDPAAPAPPTSEPAATIDGEVISIEEYKDHLLRVHGRKLLRELVYGRLLEREAERLQLSVSDEELDQAADERWNLYLNTRHQGSEQGFLQMLKEEGYTESDFRSNFKDARRRELLQTRICQATRVPSEEQLLERFDREYGVGGVKVEVRHLMLNRAGVKADLTRGGLSPDELTPEVVQAECMRRAEALLVELRAGGDFEALARRHSNDLSVTQNGGLIPGYNYLRYGAPMAAVVRAAAEGEAAGPVVTPTAVHIVRVESRVTTLFEEVREALQTLLGEAPPSWQELRDLELRLRAGAVVRYY